MEAIMSYDKSEWQQWKSNQHDNLLQEWVDCYGELDTPEQEMIVNEGIRSRIDNKYASAEKKAEAVKDNASLTLADLLPTRGGSGQKAGLVEKAIDLGLDKAVAESMTIKQLQAIINSLG
jgi:hypothetical protein